MTQIPLLGAPYQGRSVISSAQRAVNLYAELNSTPVASYTYAMDPQAPVPVTYYPTPGTLFYAQDLTNQRAVRGTYRTSKGAGYCVIGSNLYFVNANGALAPIGVVADRPSQVYFADNGSVVVLVDGVNGYVVDIATNNFGQIIDPAFYGADFVGFLDTFFIFNRPGTNQFYISLSQVDFGMLTGSSAGSGTITTAGSGYAAGTYQSVPATGGSGQGQTIDVTISDGGIADGVITNGGTLYPNGTYTDVPLINGSGANAIATFTISGGIVKQVAITATGTGFIIGDVLSAAAPGGGAGSGFTYEVTALLNGFVSLVNLSAGGSGYVIGDVLSADAANLGGGTASGKIAAPGSGYAAGVYQNVSLLGGSGNGATANIVVSSGLIATGAITNAGSLYTNGTYTDVALTGGGGSFVTADITVAGGVVTAVVIKNRGIGYVAANVLGVNALWVGGTGSGFAYTVSTIATGPTVVSLVDTGTGYTNADVLTVNPADLGNGSGTGFRYTVINGSGFTYTIETGSTAFDPLDIAAKSGSADPIAAILVLHRELWLVGQLTTEVWVGTGAADFYFQEQQGAYIDHGCAAPYSAANTDVIGMWIMQDRQGQAIVVQGQNYTVTEVSTPRIVEEFSSYSTIADAIGFCFQISDHAFYCLTFPTANKTWLFELKTGRWCEWAWTDDNGELNRHRANCCMFLNNKLIVGDWENGKLLELNKDTYTDELSPITRIRTFPHIVGNGVRIRYASFIADIEVGTYDDQNGDPPTILLSWSDDRGVTYGNPVEQSLGSLGDYLAQPSWDRLGMARDRVFKLQWSAPMKTALNGAYVEYVPAKT